MKFKRIRTKIMISILGCAITTAIIIGGISIKSSTTEIKEEATEKLEYIVEGHANELDGKLEVLENTARNLAISAQAECDFDRINDDNYLDEYIKDIDPIINKYVQSIKGATGIFLELNPKFGNKGYGVWYADVDNDNKFEKKDVGSKEDVEQEYNKNIAKINKWSNVYRDNELDKDIITYTVPIYEDGDILAIICVDMDFDIFRDFVKQR